MDDNIQQAIRDWTLAQPVVSAYVTSIVRDFRDRDDVLQSIAVAVLESYPSYDASRPFIGRAIGIARNQIRTYLREKRRDRIVFDGRTIDTLANVFDSMSRDESHSLDHLHECLDKLEGRPKQLCQMRYENDLKPAAIAKLLNMSPNAVAKSLQRIRDQLRQCVEQRWKMRGMPS